MAERVRVVTTAKVNIRIMDECRAIGTQLALGFGSCGAPYHPGHSADISREPPSPHRRGKCVKSSQSKCKKLCSNFLINNLLESKSTRKTFIGNGKNARA